MPPPFVAMNMSTNNLLDLSVIVPLYNEEAILLELYERLCRVVGTISDRYELIFVNDGSKDQTGEGIMRLAEKDVRVRFIHFTRNFGHQIAIAAGIDHCRGRAVVIIDGDLQDPPELITQLYARYRQGYKVVYAQRRTRKGDPRLKKFAAAIFYRLLARATNFEIPIDTGDFRLIDHDVVRLLRQMPEQNKFFRGQIAWTGYKQTSVEFDRDPRKTGVSNYSYWKLLRLALDGMTSFSDKPLKFATVLGFSVFIFAFIMIIYALYSYYILERIVPGWTSMIISAMFIGGAQLLSVGIIGEYISRIINNVRQRPLYVIENCNLSLSSDEMQ